MAEGLLQRMSLSACSGGLTCQPRGSLHPRHNHSWAFVGQSQSEVNIGQQTEMPESAPTRPTRASPTLLTSNPVAVHIRDCHELRQL